MSLIFLLFTLYHFCRILPCRLPYPPADACKNNNHYATEYSKIYPGTDNCPFYIVFKPKLHQHIPYRECDDGCNGQQKHVFFHKHNKNIPDCSSVHLAYSYLFAPLLATQSYQREDTESSNKYTNHGNKTQQLHQSIF